MVVGEDIRTVVSPPPEPPTVIPAFALSTQLTWPQEISTTPGMFRPLSRASEFAWGRLAGRGCQRRTPGLRQRPSTVPSLGATSYVVAGDQAAGARHVLRHDGRIARNVLADGRPSAAASCRSRRRRRADEHFTVLPVEILDRVCPGLRRRKQHGEHSQQCPEALHSSRSALFRHSAHGRAEALSMASLLVSASALVIKLIGPPMRDRLQLQPGVDLGVDRRGTPRLGSDGADHRIAVTAHQHDGGVLAERLRASALPSFGVSDQQVGAVRRRACGFRTPARRARGSRALCKSGRNGFAR